MNSEPPAGGRRSPAVEALDLLHTPTSDHFTWSETNYFGFHVPEERINGEIYVWLHPNLKVASAGVFVWQGMKRTALAAEYFDFRQFLPFPEGDLDDYQLANGLGVKVCEAERTYLVDYADRERNTEAHLAYEAIAPPIPYPGGRHYDQPMRVKGQVVLNGRDLEIDGYFTRDHSWGERSEAGRPGPPVTYLTGIFDERFAFHLTAYDHVDSVPEWKGTYTLETGSNLIAGYVFDGSRVRRLENALKRTYRGPDGLQPRRIVLELTDETGEQHQLLGEVTALLPWHPWPNLLCFMCQVRWSRDGRFGWGDAHEILTNDFVHRFMR